MKAVLLFGFLLIHSAISAKGLVTPGPTKTWLTLNGTEPVVIARGGFSGLFPESSSDGYKAALQQSKPGTIMYCDLQLTKDNLGVCHSDINLDNSTNVRDVFPQGQKTYNVNGQDITGWFAFDYTYEQLQKDVHLIQNIRTRTNVLNYKYSILTPDVMADFKPYPKLWMNVQYDMFYNKNNLTVARYILDSAGYWVADYISSPEIGFLKTMGAKTMDKMKTKLIFRFLNPDKIEPTTKEKYGDLLGKLATVKTFASGILVPKEYIWPVSKDLYLQPATTLVTEAHKVGLEVFASGFANDLRFSHNYSFDPIAEYLQFIDNSQFSVDGVLTDFPPTASEAISCLAQNKNVSTKTREALVISHNGASGDYPGCTDLAYEKAINDGADIIDCNVQLSKDGIAFCLDSPDLTGKTTATMTFTDRSASLPEVQNNTGIFSFDLTWSEIQSLKPQIVNPFAGKGLQRNPRFKNAGKIVTLPEFLALAKTKANIGILITIENDAYLASKKGFNIVDMVTSALCNATFDKQSTQKVLIQSDDSSILKKFKDFPTYQRVLLVNEPIGGSPGPVAEDVKKYAEAITLPKSAIVNSNLDSLSTRLTNIVEEMRVANVSVYVSGFMNEFANILVDLFYDPYTELATYLLQQQIHGVITDHPKSASAFMRTRCVNLNVDFPYNILPIQEGDFLYLVEPVATPSPTEAPKPRPLEVADIVDPPLPAVANVSVASDIPAAAPLPSSGQPTIVANVSLSIEATLLID